MKKAMKYFDDNEENNLNNINSQMLLNPRKVALKMAKVQHKSEFKEDIKDLIVLLSRVFGYLHSKDLYLWMVC